MTIMDKKKSSPKTKGNKLTTRDLQREVLRLFRKFPKKQFNPKQVGQKLSISNSKDALQHVIDQLVAAGAVVARDDYKYQLVRDFHAPTEEQTAVGRVDMTRTGSAYIVVEGVEEDIYVAANNTRNALNGDTVRVAYWKQRGRKKAEGKVIEIVKRNAEQFVGILHLFARYALVKVEGKQEMDISVSLEDIRGAQHGDMVVVKMKPEQDTPTGRTHNNPKGMVTVVMGKPGSSSMDMQAILINNGFNIAFPEEVIAESEALPGQITEADVAARRDFRGILTFTIDPLTAKDFDDALSYRPLENGHFEVGVHIADVSHYVLPNSALDQEAYKRSTSVYLVDRVCPMLPERLSNELCSLRPHEDKLAFSAVFEFSADYKVVNRWFGKTIIHSDRRFTYEEAQEVLDTGQGDYPEELTLLNKVAQKLRERRFKEGSIDFATEEVRFRLAEDGTPLEVYVKERIDTNMLIEDFMLLANREVSSFIARKEKERSQVIPFIYRVHDEPDPDKAMELALFAAALGFTMDVSSPVAIARSYNRLLKKAETDHSLKLLAPLAIRTMAKAVYTSKNIGHYGLGFAHYSHFTSPIRRYSDVLAHRILEQNLPKDSLYQVNATHLEEQCKHISNQERKATEAERESIKYKQVEFIEKHVGEDFVGVINGIADFGVFVELKESRCEGMISYDNMDQAYDIGEGKFSIKGRRNRKEYRMGDEINVRVLAVDLKRRRIELGMVK